MSDVVIRAENLRKRYRLGAPASRGTLRDALGRLWHSPSGMFHSRKREEFWALDGLDLAIHAGEVVGIIGRNGAGKTTLLKIVSRITRPSSGCVEVHGRVGSLLEVGTGFHPELSGRENTFLSGAILGMTRREILRKFDDIVAFAEIEKFIDTAVKHYSSGMFVRLAFAVAAHLEPEILLVDEVLAVGDAAFQKKCLGKMGDVSRQGRTVLFVSHNMGAIAQLSQRCILLDRGRLLMQGRPDRVISEHLRTSAVRNSSEKDWERFGSGRVRISSIELLDHEGAPCASASMGQDLRIRIGGRSELPGTEFSLAAQFVSPTGIPVLYLYDQFQTFRPRDGNNFLIELRVPELLLTPGMYSLHAWVGRAGMEDYDYVKNAVSFDLVQGENVPVTLPITQEQGLVYGRFDARQIE
jgi:lipopolysaccharide transport system ATP-binding protein